MRLDIVPSVDLDTQKINAHAAIDDAAGRARARYITIAPGQEATYQMKAAEADRYKAAGYPSPVDPMSYPWIASEAPARSMTLRDLADEIIATRDGWVFKGAQIEGARMGGKTAVTNATTPAAIAAARRAAIEALDVL